MTEDQGRTPAPDAPQPEPAPGADRAKRAMTAAQRAYRRGLAAEAAGPITLPAGVGLTPGREFTI